VKERVLQLEDESLRKSFLDEGIGHMFFGPTAAESVDASLSGRALSWARLPLGQHVPPICFCCILVLSHETRRSTQPAHQTPAGGRNFGEAAHGTDCTHPKQVVAQPRAVQPVVPDRGAADIHIAARHRRHRRDRALLLEDGAGQHGRERALALRFLFITFS